MHETNARSVPVGAVLKQIDGGTEISTLSYSLGLKSDDRNYSKYERDLLVLVKAGDAFTDFLLDPHFTLPTDNNQSRQLGNVRGAF